MDWSWLTSFAYAPEGEVRRLRGNLRGLRRLLRTQRAAARDRDEGQDQRIARLEAENDDLALCVATLLRLLATRGVIDEADWLSVVETLQDPVDADALEPLDEADPPVG